MMVEDTPRYERTPNAATRIRVGVGEIVVVGKSADVMVVVRTLGVIGIVLAIAIKQLGTRLLRWRPEYQK